MLRLMVWAARATTNRVTLSFSLPDHRARTLNWFVAVKPFCVVFYSNYFTGDVVSITSNLGKPIAQNFEGALHCVVWPP
jgi:hypothetical protein